MLEVGQWSQRCISHDGGRDRRRCRCWPLVGLVAAPLHCCRRCRPGFSRFTDVHMRLAGWMVASLCVPAVTWQRVQRVTPPPATHQWRISGRLRFAFVCGRFFLPLLLTGLSAELHILLLIKLTLLLVLSYLTAHFHTRTPPRDQL